MNVDISDIFNLQSMVDRRARERNLAVEFEVGAVTAYTTENKIVLPSPRLPMTRDELDLVYGYMIHETGHHTRPRAFEILGNSGLTNQHPIYNLFNVTEDGAMEREVGEQFSGDRKALGKGMLRHVKNQVERLSTFPKEFFVEPDQIKAMAVYRCGLEARKDWDLYVDEALGVFEPTQTPSSKELYAELEKEGWVGRFATPTDPDGSWNLACDLYKRLYPEADQDKVEQIRKQGQAKGKGKGEKETGEGMPGYQPDKGEGEGKEEEVPGNISYSWKDWVNSDHDGKGIPATINWDGRVFENGVQILDPPNVNVVVCKDSHSSKGGHTDASAASLANAIRIYIQAQSRTHIKPEQFKGKLDRRALTRLAYPPIDSGEWNKKIFYTLENKRYKNTCIGILTDWSGSMNGQKKSIAAEATARLARVFDIQLRVPTTIAAFSGGHNTCSIGIIKEFHGKDSARSIHSKFDFFDSWTNGNSDGDAILWMYERLAKRKEQRKILIVLSDGAPTDGHPNSNPDDLLKKVTMSIEAKPDFTLIGIGIATKQVKRYYKNYKVIDNVKELDKELLKVLKETYTHG